MVATEACIDTTDGIAVHTQLLDDNAAMIEHKSLKWLRPSVWRALMLVAIGLPGSFLFGYALGESVDRWFRAGSDYAVVDEQQGAGKAGEDNKLLGTLLEDRLRAYASSSASARDALNTLKRLEARLEVGVNYQYYTDVVGEAWAEVRIFVESPEGKRLWEFSALLKEGVAHYKSARDVWQDKINRAYETAGVIEEDRLQSEWRDASVSIANAHQMLDPATCVQAIRMFVQNSFKTTCAPYGGTTAVEGPCAAQEFKARLDYSRISTVSSAAARLSTRPRRASPRTHNAGCQTMPRSLCA